MANERQQARRKRRANIVLTSFINLFGLNALIQALEDRIVEMIETKVKKEKNKKYFLYGKELLMDSVGILTDNDLDNERQFKDLMFNEIEVLAHFGHVGLVQRARYHLDRREGISREDKDRIHMLLNDIIVNPSVGFDFDQYLANRENERKAHSDTDLV